MHSSKVVFRSLGLCLLAVISMTGCSHNEAASQKQGEGPPVEVGVVTVKSEAVPVTTELPGRIDAVRMAQVRARVAGILLKQLFKEGADVNEGDVLFEIDPAPLHAIYDSAKANVAKAEANLTQAQAKADRYKNLVEFNAVSKQDYVDAVATAEQAGAEVLAAKAALETASLNLGYAKVTAPISGKIGKAKVTEGALVGQNEATELAVIQQMDPVYFDFTQSSTDVLRLRQALKKGNLQSVSPEAVKISLLLEDGTTYANEGKLMFSDISVDPTTGMITLRAEFPNAERMLLPGMFARARLEQAVNNEALTVPQRGVARGPNGTATVLVVDADNKVQSRLVQAETAVGDKWVVSSGVKAGDRVIVEGVQKVRPGATVKTVPFVESEKQEASAQTTPKAN
ncbi:efflux RND transporter periplasmic adaptor subunit [Pedosphaera parvula]|uniref:Efflux transporter, RND family, MFP subunit n=1 Tax=Pedosphaera parvula (strain Ellin514) TaxID=320771 RepID=B9XB34_PEDPL|nr:efflux RND transporter periplasmic adaptor subunit [Pedosphaera parvula]EEF62719.1 efflux transporter, RND family, MFP subunit [Pedosphaera parvula Ellin514]